ncbi:MAG: nicotinate (nicotinamide) nucleotide adenylyltransferase [Planctomycetes bacterium]|nr:nicotinate (nicotinamide) nucleotide adenylyltransferase [Planctomycetota bacterium]
MSPARRRIGLYGGSFDPPHLGHLHVARAARTAFELDELRFVPAARPPHKQGRVLAPAADRVAMLELALGELEREAPGGWSVDARELRREGPSYTIRSVDEVLAEEGGPERVELFVVLGSDNLRGLERWYEVERMLALARPVVVVRDGADPTALLAELDARLSPAAMARLRAGLLALPPVPASSTEVRRGETLERMPAAVRAYVDAHGLYAEGA